jgi:hypothetical protein
MFQEIIISHLNFFFGTPYNRAAFKDGLAQKIGKYFAHFFGLCHWFFATWAGFFFAEP